MNTREQAYYFGTKGAYGTVVIEIRSDRAAIRPCTLIFPLHLGATKQRRMWSSRQLLDHQEKLRTILSLITSLIPFMELRGKDQPPKSHSWWNSTFFWTSPGKLWRRLGNWGRKYQNLHNCLKFIFSSIENGWFTPLTNLRKGSFYSTSIYYRIGHPYYFNWLIHQYEWWVMRRRIKWRPSGSPAWSPTPRRCTATLSWWAPVRGRYWFSRIYWEM